MSRGQSGMVTRSAQPADETAMTASAVRLIKQMTQEWMRDLIGRDSNGCGDPAVFIKAFGKTLRTQTKQKQSSPVWDEQLFFEAKDVDEDFLYRTTFEVTVYNVNTVKRSDIIGQYFFDAMSIYYAQDHEIHRHRHLRLANSHS